MKLKLKLKLSGAALLRHCTEPSPIQSSPLAPTPHGSHDSHISCVEPIPLSRDQLASTVLLPIPFSLPAALHSSYQIPLSLVSFSVRPVGYGGLVEAHSLCKAQGVKATSS